MKTLSRPTIITPTNIVLTLLAATIAFIDITNTKIPFLSNTRIDILLVVAIGMVICSQCGIGRIAATKQWSHPLSIVGYILGGLILLVTLAVVANWELPFVQNDQQAFFTILILACLKMINAMTHHFLAPGKGI
jgi:hypothetical protein